MVFNLIVLLAIILLTAYYATNGLLSAALAFVSAVFASLLAMALFEPLQGFVAVYWPHLARGTAFMAVFALGFAICRLAADFAVPRNIKLAKLIDSVGGGVVGFFAALAIVGTCVLGIGMLPVRTTILGFGGDQEYSSDGRMQGPQQGAVVPDSGLHMAPQRFTLALWDGASNRSLGGSRAFSEIHPDLPMESYGYRNVTQYGSNPALIPELLSVEGVMVSDAQELLTKCNIEAGYSAAVVRIEVTKGTDSPKVSADIADSFFRITPTQVRLITSKGQRYPIGILSNGTTFEATPLDTGHLVEDYVNMKVLQDWVFQIDKDETPIHIEVKQLARAELSKKEKLSVRLAADYPQREYRQSAGSLIVTVHGDAKPVADTTVRLARVSVDLKKIDSAKTAANSHVEGVNQKARDGEEPWISALGKPGVPAKTEVDSAYRAIVAIGNENQVRWDAILPALVMWKLESDGQRNHNALPAHFRDNVAPLVQKETLATAKTDANGKAVFDKVSPGEYSVISDAKIPDGGYYVWASTVKVEKKTEAKLDLRPQDARFKLTPVK